MTDWPHSSNPSQDSNQGSLCFGKSERLFHSAKRAMDWLKFYSKIQDMYCQTLKFKICTARRSVGWRSDYEGHWSKEAITEFKISFIGIVYKATWKAMKKKAFIPLLCLPTFLHSRMRPKVVFDQQLEESWDFLDAVALQAGEKFQSNLRRKQIFVIFNDCRDMLQNVDQIICWPFPLNRVLNQKLTNIELDYWSWYYFTTFFLKN